MKKDIALIIFTLVISACGTVPKSSSQLVDSSGTTETYCYSKSPGEVGSLIEEYLGKCYGPVETLIPVGGILVPMKADFQVIHEKLPNGNRYSVRNFVGFGYAANVIGDINGCETEVKMYAVSESWRKAFIAVDQEITGQNPKCP